MRNKRGFTLIELMICVIIIVILASVAYPSYRDYILRTNRAAATACLLELAQVMERNYTRNLRYNPNGFVLPVTQCQQELAARYAFTLAEPQAQRTFLLSAVPTSLQNDGCGTLTLNQAGLKGANGDNSAVNVQACW